MASYDDATLEVTRLHMPLPNVNMPCPLLFWLVIVFTLEPPALLDMPQLTLLSHLPHFAVTSPGLFDVSRDNSSLIVTQCLGLPQLYSHPTIPLSVHYALNLFYRAQKPAPFTLSRTY